MSDNTYNDSSCAHGSSTDAYGGETSYDYGCDCSVTTGEALDEHYVVVPEGTTSTDPRIQVTQSEYDLIESMYNEKTGNSSYAGSNGIADVSDGDIEALLREIYQESAQISSNLLNVYAMQMQSSNEKVDELTTKAESVMSVANEAENSDDEVELDSSFDFVSAANVYADAGEEIPDWIRAGLNGETAKPKKSELESTSRMYTNEANSEQSNGQLIMNKLQTAQNRFDEALRLMNSFEADRHDLAKTIAQT